MGSKVSQVFPILFADRLLLALRNEASKRDSLRFQRETLRERSHSRRRFPLDVCCMEALPANATDEASEDSDNSSMASGTSMASGHSIHGGLPRHNKNFEDVIYEADSWSRIIDDIEKIGETLVSPNWNVPQEHPVAQEIQMLVPWDIVLIRAATLSKARRLPSKPEFSHRACVYRQTNGKLIIETEDAGGVVFPRQRFDSPVAVAVFIFGFAKKLEGTEGAQDQPATDEGPEDKSAFVPPTIAADVKHSHELWFEGITEDQVPRAVRAEVARMHKNLDHPRWQEFIRLLVGHGANNSTLAAANALCCATCKRKEAKRQPLPSTMPVIGQFNDRIYKDLCLRMSRERSPRRTLGYNRQSHTLPCA